MLQKLVFVKYNQTLKENRESDEYIDPVLMDDPEINAGSEWLLGDEVHDRDAQSDAVYDDDDDLGWLDLKRGVVLPSPYSTLRAKQLCRRRQQLLQLLQLCRALVQPNSCIFVCP